MFVSVQLVSLVGKADTRVDALRLNPFGNQLSRSGDKEGLARYGGRALTHIIRSDHVTSMRAYGNNIHFPSFCSSLLYCPLSGVLILSLWLQGSRCGMEASANELYDSGIFLPQSPGEQVPDTGETHDELPAQPVLEPREYFPEPPAEGVFQDKEHLLGNLRKHALSQGYAITIQKSNPNKNLYIGCDRGGVPKDKNSASPAVRRRHKMSRKCGCPFQLIGKRMKKATTWELKIRNPIHNHPADQDMLTHPSARRLTAEQRRHIKHLNVIGVKPRDIMSFLKLESPNALLLPRDIYNELAKLKREHEAPPNQQTAFQQLASQQIWPQVPLPQQSTPQEASPQQASPRRTSPRIAIPQQSTPQGK